MKKADYWVALPIDAPGSMTGDTLADLFTEVETFKHFCLGAPADAAVTVDYVYDLPEVGEDVLTAYRDLQSQRDQITRHLEDAAKTAVSRLKQAGVSVRDSAALLGMSPSHVDQLMHSA
jgi:hypothetical protein